MSHVLLVVWIVGVAATGILSTAAGAAVARVQLGFGSRGEAAALSIAAVVVCAATVAAGLATVW